jgi:glycosyltransferase involved in cell wall biosynthesis
VWVLDACDDETQAILQEHPAFLNAQVNVLHVDFRDLGLSRNAGVKVTNGHAVAIFDGDDYYSKNWLVAAWNCLKQYGEKSILHPEFCITFGTYTAYAYHPDQKGELFSIPALFSSNLWTSWTFAMREVYLKNPYSVTRPFQTGFGYEDWHWNCETIALGYEHRVVPKTIGFYRRKRNSVVESSNALDVIIPSSKLFSKESCFIWGKNDGQ